MNILNESVNPDINHIMTERGNKHKKEGLYYCDRKDYQDLQVRTAQLGIKISPTIEQLIKLFLKDEAFQSAIAQELMAQKRIREKIRRRG